MDKPTTYRIMVLDDVKLADGGIAVITHTTATSARPAVLEITTSDGVLFRSDYRTLLLMLSRQHAGAYELVNLIDVRGLTGLRVVPVDVGQEERIG